MQNTVTKWGWLVILVTFALFASPHLGFPPRPVFDEIYTALAAQEITAGLVPHEITHPPLSKLIMAGAYLFWLGGRFVEATETWSPIGFAIRTPSILAALLSLWLLFRLTESLTGDRVKATFAMALLALDSMFLVMARTAMTNIYGICFTLMCVLGCWYAIKNRQARWLFLAGLGLGLGAASRWTAVVGSTVAVMIVLTYLVATRTTPREWLRWLSIGVLAMVLLPAAIYLTSYFPQVWAATHHDWAKVFSGKTVNYLWRVHQYAVNSHKGIPVPSPDYSPWYTWPLMLRPVWFYLTPYADPVIRGVWAIGNGLVWWATLPALFYGLFQGIQRRRWELLAPTVLAAGLWLVWAAARSPINYMHYMFESIPFVCILIADVAVSAWRMGSWQRYAVGTYCLLLAGWAVWFYPLLVATPVSREFQHQHYLLGTANWDSYSRLIAWRKENHMEDDKTYRKFVERWFPNPELFMDTVQKVDKRRKEQRKQLTESTASPQMTPATEGAASTTAPTH